MSVVLPLAKENYDRREEQNFREWCRRNIANALNLAQNAGGGTGDVFVGDSGTGGAEGIVPAPAAGDAAAGKFLHSNGSWAAPPGAGGGEANTASNIGTAGVGIFKTKSGINLQFKKLNAGNTAITITDDVGNNEVDISLDALNGTAILNVFTSVLKGLAPASGGGTSNFLRADGAWVVPPGSSGEANTASNIGTAGVGLFKTKSGADLQFKKINAGNNAITVTDDVGNNEVDIALDATNGTATLNVFTPTLKGLAPLSGGGTANFLRADGTWGVPPAGSPAGSTTQIQYNNAGAFGASANFAWDNSASRLTLNGDARLKDGSLFSVPCDPTIGYPDLGWAPVLKLTNQANPIYGLHIGYLEIKNNNVAGQLEICARRTDNANHQPIAIKPLEYDGLRVIWDTGVGNGNGVNLELNNTTTAGTTGGDPPWIYMRQANTNVAANMWCGGIYHSAKNLSGASRDYGYYEIYTAVVTAGAEEGYFKCNTYVAGVDQQAIRFGKGLVVGTGTTLPGVGSIALEGFVKFVEQASPPAAPATNNVVLYAEDNGAGKTRLMARFATGAAVQVAIEP